MDQKLMKIMERSTQNTQKACLRQALIKFDNRKNMKWFKLLGKQGRVNIKDFFRIMFELNMQLEQPEDKQKEKISQMFMVKKDQTVVYKDIIRSLELNDLKQKWSVRTDDVELRPFEVEQTKIIEDEQQLLNGLKEQFKTFSNQKAIKSATLDSNRRNASSTQVSQSIKGKLNRLSLDLICQNKEQEIQDIETVTISSKHNRLKSAQPRQNIQSTFNNYYLSAKHKDLLSIQTAKDFNKEEGSKSVKGVGEIILNLREATTNAPTMIMRLQDETAKENQFRDSTKLFALKSPHDTSQLLNRILLFLANQDMQVQKLNGLRYECMRQSQDYFITGRKFLKIYKQYGIVLTQNEQKDFLDYMSIQARKGTFNLDQLTKLFQIVARIQYKKQLEDIEKELIEPKKSQMDRFILSIQKKVMLAFGDSIELVRWLSLSGRESVKPEEFWFGIQFFSTTATFVDSMVLFNQLDQNKDGFVDAEELTWLLQRDENQEKALSYKYQSGIGQQDLCPKNVQQLGGEKKFLGMYDDLDLPKFQRARRDQHARKLYGREQSHKDKKAFSLQKAQQRDKQQRKLVILETKDHTPVEQKVHEHKQYPVSTSIQMARILQNTYVNQAAMENREHERVNFLDTMFNKNQPVFKSYMQNNTQIVRASATNAKITAKRQNENKQRNLCQSVRYSSSYFVDRLKPMNTVLRLMNK